MEHLCRTEEAHKEKIWRRDVHDAKLYPAISVPLQDHWPFGYSDHFSDPREVLRSRRNVFYLPAPYFTFVRLETTRLAKWIDLAI